MKQPSSDWKQSFSALFHPAVKKYQGGHTKARGLVNAKGAKFLASIGYSEQEFFDFIEDFAKAGEPTLATALKIAAVRRDYFLKEQKGKPSPHRVSMEKLPSKDAVLGGIKWLPRIIVKAEAKLRGEMPPELMYSCGGDRRFLKEYHLKPADFLKTVWKAQGKKAEIVAWVKAKAKS